MAKRRTLVPPTAAELDEMEKSLSATSAPKAASMAPIAQVAGDAARATEPGSTSERAQAERHRADATALQAAKNSGRLILEIPLEEIAATEMVRDRMTIDDGEMEELRNSILANGLRLPIEVFEIVGSQDRDGQGRGERYGLLSGYRRYLAVQALRDYGIDRFATIRAIIREPGSIAQAFQDMVEENEIRSGLSPFERGRIAVLSVTQGGFASVEEAVDKLFLNASKSKRSKVRSFALIHEELGDLLRFPRDLSERSGLRLANALRAGQGGAIREALVAVRSTSPDAEWEQIEPVLRLAEANPTDPARGGRPKADSVRKKPLFDPRRRTLVNGTKIRVDHDGKNFMIRFEGRQVNYEMLEIVIQQIEHSLGPSEP